MKKKETASFVMHALAAFMPILAGIGLDYAAMTMRKQASESFDFGPSVAFNLALPIILALIFLVLVWYLFRYLPHPRPAAYFYLAAGLLGTFSVVAFFPPVFSLFPSPAFRAFRMWVAQLGFGSFHLISGFLLVLGIVGSIQKEG